MFFPQSVQKKRICLVGCCLFVSLFVSLFVCFVCLLNGTQGVIFGFSGSIVGVSFVFFIPGLFFILLGRAVYSKASVRILNDTDFSDPELMTKPISPKVMIGEKQEQNKIYLKYIYFICSYWRDFGWSCDFAW
jgi:hypothetical protein